MALLHIIKYPDPYLKTKATEVDLSNGVSEEVETLISNMVETMYAEAGVGLAAVQVGSDKRIFICDVPTEIDENEKPIQGPNLVAVINPVIVEKEGTQKFDEGCLSVPGINAEVKRAEFVVIEGFDKDGDPIRLEGEGLLAVCFQHEIDHLDGIVFLDHLSRLKRAMIIKKINRMEGGAAL